jgi:chromate transport protein ChrA
LITLACDGLLVCAMALGFQANDNRVMGAMAAIPAFLLVSIVGMIGVTVSYEHIDTVESRVEGEIERYWA